MNQSRFIPQLPPNPVFRALAIRQLAERQENNRRILSDAVNRSRFDRVISTTFTLSA